MSNKIITLKLSSEDVGQILDGLSIRRDVWRETQKYLNGETGGSIIEDCCNIDEACWVADDYDRIIGCIKEQI